MRLTLFFIAIIERKKKFFLLLFTVCIDFPNGMQDEIVRNSKDIIFASVSQDTSL